MSFGVPTALFWLALSVPVIALYIVRVRLRRVPVSTGLFWKQIYEEKPPRSFWQQFRHLLSLLLQLLMLLLLILAAADPVFPWQLSGARRIVVVVDASAGMQAVDLEPNRFAVAVQEAGAVVDGLRSHDEMAVVLAGARPQVVMGMSSHVPTLRRALKELQVQDGPADLDGAIDLAGQLIGDHPAGHIIVVTDGCSPAEDRVDRTTESEVASPAVEFRVFSSPAANIGITQFQARRSLTDPIGYEVLVQVRNLASAAVECRFELELDGLPVDILPLTLAAGESWRRSLENTSPAGGLLSGRLTQVRSADGEARDGGAVNSLSVDDTAWAVLPPRDVQDVLLVTPGNLFLQKVFEASPLVNLEVLHELPEIWPSDSVIVLHQLVPDELPTGPLLVVDPRSNSRLWSLGDTATGSVIAEQKTTSPLMTHVRLDNVMIPAVRQVTPAGSARLLAGSLSGDPVYLELMREEGRCLLLNISLEESDLAFRTAFPILVSNALTWLSRVGEEQVPSLAAGDVATVALELPPESQTSTVEDVSLRLMDPQGTAVGLAVSTRDRAGNTLQTVEAVIGPLTRAGLHQVVAEDATPVAELAVNLSNERESDLRPSEQLKSSNGEPPVTAGWLSRPLWFYLATLACVLTVTEWFLYHRRFTD